MAKTQPTWITRNKTNFNHSNIKKEINTGEVHTKPNGAQSIRDILFRNTQGMSYDNYKTPYYEDQATFSSQSYQKIQDMEPTEKLQYLEAVKKNVETLKTKIEDFEREKQNLLLEEARKNAAEAVKREQSAATQSNKSE